MGASTVTGRTAPDGSPYPDRTQPTFERDVRRMFTHIAERYEWFDHLASLGNDYLWRPRALWDLDRFRPDGPPVRVLDLGCGTGELARQVARHYPGARVFAADFTRAMLVKAAQAAEGHPEAPRLDFGRATALRLPFAAASFDLVTNAFVARNLADLPQALGEMRRVLRPGGVLLTLEITEPVSPRFGRLFHAYFDRVVPSLGAVVRSAGPYRYLPESLRSLPPRDRFLEAMQRAGFPRTEARAQSMGIVTTFLGEAEPSPTQSR
jgi:demethylmenaquinone methyltransferase / 2-methoxy-6-polyprenyl-1,4-benzoquinol methylase